jgi:hypothetical protein
MVMPFGIGNDTMFQPYPFNLKRFVEKCQTEYDILPRPHWITTYYGGHVCFSVLISITLINSHFFLWFSIFFNYHVKERGNQSTLKYYFMINLNATNDYFTIVFDGI